MRKYLLSLQMGVPVPYLGPIAKQRFERARFVLLNSGTITRHIFPRQAVQLVLM